VTAHLSALSGEQLQLIYQSGRDIEQDFWQFHEANPEIYAKLVNLARTVKAAGHERYGMSALFERLRWHHFVELRSQEPFKANNNFRSFYSRLIMEQEPDLADFFETREQRHG
jgi:hypothetical protein